jgi:RimJ/RimL family protein N-acetyltransferase
MSEEHATRDRAPSVRAVDLALPRPRPERLSLPGDRVRVEPLDPARHGPDLFRFGHDGGPAAEQSWEYLPYGPFASEGEHRSWLELQAASEDPLYFAIVRDDRAAGVATLTSIVPAHGTIEIGHIWLSPGLQRTSAATEALVLLLRYAMDDLGYRRMEWKRNAANDASRRAAVRLGFRFEGVFQRSGRVPALQGRVVRAQPLTPLPPSSRAGSARPRSESRVRRRTWKASVRGLRRRPAD